MAEIQTNDQAAAVVATAKDVEIFERGVQALKENKLENAVQLLGQALELRIEKHGERAVESASAYFRYGCALFYRAQEESDVLGGQIKSKVPAKDEGSSVQAGATTQGQAADRGGLGAPNPAAGPDAKGKGIAAPPAPKPQAEGLDEDIASDDNEDAAEMEDEEEEDDIELSWKMLEVARTIYEEQKDSYKLELADVHMLLADLSTEQENFETAHEDLKIALGLLTSALKEDDRRLAEIHYKMCLALQSMHQPNEALKEAKIARSICTSRVENLKALNTTEAKQETDNLQPVLEELTEKEDELIEVGRELQKTKDSLYSVFKQAVGSSSGGGSVATPASGSQVINLGVVGQGKRRINVAPIPQSADGAKPTAEAKPKRTLDDLMGGSKSAAKFSFQPVSGAVEVTTKKAKTDTQEDGRGKEAGPASVQLPSFLQPGSVEAVYGSEGDAAGK